MLADMKPEKVFDPLLGLGEHWRVKEVSYQKDNPGEVRICIEERKSLYQALSCSEDGASVYCYDHRAKRQWRHLNVFQHNCTIECELPRVKCRKCGQVKTLTAPWEGKIKHFTLLFEAFALTLLREVPVKTVADLLGEHDTRLWRMLEAYVREAYEQLDFSTAEVIGCDELSARKGHKYVSVFAELRERAVLFATEGKDHRSWDRFMAEFIKHNGQAQQIKSISMDMSRAYPKGAKKHCSKAAIVYDRFHVFKSVNEGIDEVRGKESRWLLQRGDPSLKDTQWLLRMSPDNHNEQQAKKLQKLREANLHSAKAYQMKLTLQDIYQMSDAIVFKGKLLAWCRWVKAYARHHPYVFSSMRKVAKSINKHLDGIVAYCEHRITNAFMEGLMSIFSATKRKARGYRSNQYLITVLYLVASKIKLPVFSPFHNF